MSKINIIKIIWSQKDVVFLIKDVNKTIKNEAKEQKDGFVSILLDTLGANL